MGRSGPPGSDSTIVLGQYFQLAMALQTALTGRTWHGQRTSGIMMIIFYFVFFHINVSMKKKRKTLSVSGTVTFLFFQVRHFFFFCFHGYCYDVLLQF